MSTDIADLSNLIQQGTIACLIDKIKGPFLQDLEIKGAEEFENWRSEFNRSFFFRIGEYVKARLPDLSPRDANELLLKSIHKGIDLLPVLTDEQRQTIRKPNSVNSVMLEVNDVAPVGQVDQLIGRDCQLDVLHSLWRQCLSGKAQFALITGSAGTGKTVLADQFLSRIAADEAARIFRLRCYETERRIGFGPIIDLLSRLISVEDLKEFESLWSAALRQVAPNLPITGETPPALSASGSRGRIFEAMLRLLTHLSQRTPVLLFVDDVQWSDPSTKALIAYLSHRMRDTRVTVVVARRPHGTTDDITPTWGDWVKVRVTEFTPEQVSKRLNTFPPTCKLSVNDLLSLTGGNPYLVSEVERSILAGGVTHLSQRSEVTPNVHRFLGTLLARLPNDAQRVLAALAVLETPEFPKLVRAVARVKQVEVVIDRLVARGLASVTGGRVGLRHDLIREVAYRRIPFFTRAELHRRVASILQKSERRAGHTAEHFFKARENRLAKRFALRASATADSRHANDESISFLRLAIKCNPKEGADLRPPLAERLFRAHRLGEARVEISRACASSSGLPTSKRLSLTMLDLEAGYLLGDFGGDELREKIKSLKAAGSDNIALLLQALRLQVKIAYHEGLVDLLSESIVELRSIGVATSGDESVEMLAHAARLESAVSSSTRANRHAGNLLTAAHRIEDHEIRMRVLSSLAAVKYEAGELQESEQIHKHALQQTERVGAITEWPLIAANTHMILVEQGRYDEASTLAKQIRDRAESLGAVPVVAGLSANMGMMFHELGDYKSAQESSERALALMSKTRRVWIHLELLGVVGLSALEQGRIKEAHELAEEGRNRLEELKVRISDLSLLEILIARVDTIHRSFDVAVDRLRAAIADYQDRDVVCRLRMQLELARMLRRTDKTQARSQAKAVFELATAINARPIAEKADSFLTRF